MVESSEQYSVGEGVEHLRMVEVVEGSMREEERMQTTQVSEMGSHADTT